ncbi:hypothetical protein Q7C36_021963 [Tachysurus vachellii]|uniref:Uncharacterized protein n=1 Tax=Tachysurus vachellii TaxID=175792 RepID=A0AA88IJY2_TACVA|nr:hypothetical protein Q7C36_021963 [Tachysurus vachellii]
MRAKRPIRFELRTDLHGAWSRDLSSASTLQRAEVATLIFGVIFTSFTDALSTEQSVNEACNQEEGAELSLSSTTAAKSAGRKADTQSHILQSHLQHRDCRNLSSLRSQQHSLMQLNVDMGRFLFMFLADC